MRVKIRALVWYLQACLVFTACAALAAVYGAVLQLRLAAADSAAYCCALADLQSAVGMGTLLLMTSSKLIFKVR
jgi:hypothetical protein